MSIRPWIPGYSQLFKILHLCKGIKLDRPDCILSKVPEREHNNWCTGTVVPLNCGRGRTLRDLPGQPWFIDDPQELPTPGSVPDPLGTALSSLVNASTQNDLGTKPTLRAGLKLGRNLREKKFTQQNKG